MDILDPVKWDILSPTPDHFASPLGRDNDRSSLNCASMLKGGWWWRSCGRGLNGLYLTDPNDLSARQGRSNPAGYGTVMGIIIFSFNYF